MRKKKPSARRVRSPRRNFNPEQDTEVKPKNSRLSKAVELLCSRMEAVEQTLIEIKAALCPPEQEVQHEEIQSEDLSETPVSDSTL